MADRTQRILAMGGARLAPDSVDWPLLQFALDLSGQERPRICMLATAGGESPEGIASFYATFARRSEPTHLDLFGRTVADVEGFLLEQDVILVAGGNTANMLAIWRIPGLDALRDGLKLLPGSFCPHYDSESLRRPRLEELIGSGALPDGHAADDSVGLLFEGRTLVEAVASLPGQHAYRVERRRGNSVEETQIRARLLR